MTFKGSSGSEFDQHSELPLIYILGVLGSLFVVFLNDISPGSILNIIVPFTIGAFLFISLSNILPELIEQKRSVFLWSVEQS